MEFLVYNLEVVLSTEIVTFCHVNLFLGRLPTKKGFLYTNFVKKVAQNPFLWGNGVEHFTTVRFI